mgnify:CR=1 FL=1
MSVKDKYLSWLPSKGNKLGSVLAVDDDFAIRIILNNVLRKSFDITTVSNGVEALLWLKKGNDPDIIISDISMPELNGFDLLKSLSQSGLYNKTPLIILSGHNKEEVRAQMVNYINPVTFIQKPFNPIEIYNHVTNIIQQKGCFT